MPYYYNSKEEFGDSGPFEAESEEAFAEEMEETFHIWAIEAWDKMEPYEKADYDGFYDDFIKNAIRTMRKNFINGLEEVQ